MTTIHLTQNDVDQAGPPFSLDRSPVALALRRTTGNEWYVYSTEAVRLADYAKIKLPYIAQCFGWAFLHGLTPLPLIEFTVDIPAPRDIWGCPLAALEAAP